MMMMMAMANDNDKDDFLAIEKLVFEVVRNLDLPFVSVGQ
jgi:hypothetical protein